MKTACFQCQKPEDEAPLNRCRVCRKHYCDEHGTESRGTDFCSLACGEFFFHAEPDEADE